MTEWNGFKAGSLYKRTGKGSRGKPLSLVVEILGTPCFGCDDDDCNRAVRLTTLEKGALQTYFIQNHVTTLRANRMGTFVDWPYIEAA